MPEINTLQQTATFVHAAALALTLAGLCSAAILAGLSRLHWFWRASLLCVPLMMLLPIRAYEPLVMLAPLMLALAVTAACLRIRWEPAVRLDRKQTKGVGTNLLRGKISLGDSLLGMTLIAIILAVLVQLPWRNLNLSWQGLCFDAGLIFWLSIASLGIVGLRGGVYWAIALFVGVFGGIVFGSICGDGLRALYLLGLDGPQHLNWAPMTVFLLGFVTLQIIVLWLLRWCVQVAGAVNQVAQRQRIVASIFALAAAPAVVLYMAMFVGPAPVPGPSVRNNSLPTLVAVAERLETLGVGDLTIRDLQRTYPSEKYGEQVEAIYQESLQLVKQPGCVALDINRQSNEDSLPAQEAQLVSLRTLARRWSREAEHAFRSGDVRRATEFDLGVLRLGNHLARGGIRIHAQAASAIKSSGLAHLAQLREQLPIDLIPVVLDVLETLDAGEENPQLTNARDRYWTDIAHGWRHRLESVVQRALRLPSTETAAFQALKQPLARETTHRRLLGTELALRHYYLEHDQYPVNLAALVPMRLALLPIDPYTQEILIYRPLQYGFALYSTGPDARDDGGKFSRFPTEMPPEHGQDWNLETLQRGGWRHGRRDGSPGPGRWNGPPPGSEGWTSPTWDRSRRPARDSVTSTAGEGRAERLPVADNSAPERQREDGERRRDRMVQGGDSPDERSSEPRWRGSPGVR